MHALHELPDDLPWHDLPDSDRWVLHDAGCSGALVAHIPAPDDAGLFLKSEIRNGFGELHDEADRLQWLAAQGIPAARVVRRARTAKRDWLLMTALPGTNLEDADLSPERKMVLLAEALRELHAVPIADCPFDHRINVRVETARARLAEGLVDMDDLDDENDDLLPRELEERLLAAAASTPTDDLVVTHGDACMNNLIVSGERFSGFIDCGRLGVADRHQDLAIACRDIADNLGAEWVDLFLARYGIRLDAEKARLFRLLDEFF